MPIPNGAPVHILRSLHPSLRRSSTTAHSFGLPTVTRMGRDPRFLTELAFGKTRGSVALAVGPAR